MASTDGEFDNAASTSYNAYATPSILRLKTLSTATITRLPTTTIHKQKQKYKHKQQLESKQKLKLKLKLKLKQKEKLSKALSGPNQSLRSALQAATLTVSVLFVSSLIAITSAAVSSATTHQSDQSTDVEATLLAGSTEKEDPLSETFPDLFNSSVLYLLAAVAPNGTTDINGTNANSGSSTFSIQGTPDSHGVANAISYATSTYDFISDSPSNASVIGPWETEVLEDFVVPPVETILINIIMLFIILGTIVGNVLVCIAVCMVRKLRRPCNYLLVSLALSDLCVAVLVMPIALLYEITEKWTFGTLVCDLWVSFDVLCCTASILNLCAISVDRYLAITKPLEYGVKRTPRRMMACVALVWLAAACISLPPVFILGNEYFGENGRAICQVCQNSAYQIYATLGSFYIPLAVMLFVYFQIFRAARRIVLEEKRAQTHLQNALNGTGLPPPLPLPQPPPPGTTDLGSGNGQQQQQHRHSSYGNTSLNYSTCGTLSVGQTSGGGLLGSPHHKKLRFQLAKEKKASTTLGIIMSAFVICWLPFFILALIRPFIETETLHVPKSLSSLFLWLGYANSLLNPIIYATLNRDFRKPFQEILYFRCSSLNTMMRENYYQDQYGEPPSQRVMLGDERHGARESFL